MKTRFGHEVRAQVVLGFLLLCLFIVPLALLHARLDRRRQQTTNAANIAKLRQGKMLSAFATTRTDDDIVVAVKAEVTQQADGHYDLMLKTVSVMEVLTSNHVLPSWEELESFLATRTILRIVNLKEA